MGQEPSPILSGEGNVDSWDSGGITLAVTDAFEIGHRAIFLATDELVDMELAVQEPSGTGAHSWTVGFGTTSTLVFLNSIHATVATMPVEILAGGLAISVLHAGGTVSEGCAIWERNAGTESHSKVYCLSDDHSFLNVGSGLSGRHSITDMDTIEVLEDGSGSSGVLYAVNIDGPTSFVDSELTLTTTGDITFSGWDIEPEAAIIIHSMSDFNTSDSSRDDAAISIGFYDGTNQRCVATYDDEGAATTHGVTGISFSDVFLQLNATNAVVGAGNITSLESDGLIVDQTDASTKLGVLIAIGLADPTPFEYLPLDKAHRPFHQPIMAH